MEGSIGTASGLEEEYNSSSSSSRGSTGFDYDENNVYDEYDDDGILVRTGTTSSRSSISSLPGSVVVHPRESMKGQQPHRFYDGIYENEDENVGGGGMKFIPRVRDKRSSPFRHPSSVRAMQMNDGDDESVISPGYRKRGLRTPRMSDTSRVSVMSPQSSASNRYHRSPNNQSPTKQNIKKEYPLVLLHCNLLPPSLSLPAGIRVPHPGVLKDVLPQQYWRRWKLLEDKIVSSGILQDRGVLISHPQEAYDLLEERLLESLELVTPRLDNGHFLGRHDEEESEDEEDDDPRGSEADVGHVGHHECPDCGTKVVRDPEGSGRKWEIKVYAANGLMKAGAWAAAWREMEKVDVEVRVWLPEEVRRDLEARILEDDALEMEEELRESEEDRRRREVYGNSLNGSQVHVDSGFGGYEYNEMRSTPQSDANFGDEEIPRYTQEPPKEPSSTPKESLKRSEHYPERSASEIDLQTLLFNYFRVLARDKRNVIIGFLGVLVLFLAVNMSGTPTVPLTNVMDPEVAHVVAPPPISSNARCAPSVGPSPSAEIVEPAIQEALSVEVPEPETTEKNCAPEPSVDAHTDSLDDSQAPKASVSQDDAADTSLWGNKSPKIPDTDVRGAPVSAENADPSDTPLVPQENENPAPEIMDTDVQEASVSAENTDPADTPFLPQEEEKDDSETLEVVDEGGAVEAPEHIPLEEVADAIHEDTVHDQGE